MSVMPEGKRCARILFALCIVSCALLFVIYHVKSNWYETILLTQLDTHIPNNWSFENLLNDKSTSADDLRDGMGTKMGLLSKYTHYELANLSNFKWLFYNSSSTVQQRTSQQIESLMDYENDTNKDRTSERLAPSNDKMAHTFLSGYRSQCWLEKISDVDRIYKKNAYASSQSGRHYFSHLTATYQALAKYGSVRAIHCLPYAMIIGFPKSGTTDLYQKLLHHPDIMGSYIKEPHFWTRHRYPEYVHQDNERTATYRNYIQLWDQPALTISYNKDANNFHPKVVIEGSASTIWDNRKWNRLPGNENLSEPLYINADDIKALMPKTKLLVIMRDPTYRMYSGFTYFKGHLDDPSAFHRYSVRAVTSMTRCIKSEALRSCVYANAKTTRKYNMTSRLHVGMYVVHIKEWLKRFPRRQMMFFRLEDYSANRPLWLQKIAQFLELDPFPAEVLDSLSEDAKSNSQDVKVEMLPETRSLLNGFYRPFNLQLANFLADPGYTWNS